MGLFGRSKSLLVALLSNINPENLDLSLDAYFDQIADQEYEFMQAAAFNIFLQSSGCALSLRRTASPTVQSFRRIAERI
jgi:hypothetical protein